jgi:hypothetical protein
MEREMGKETESVSWGEAFEAMLGEAASALSGWGEAMTEYLENIEPDNIGEDERYWPSVTDYLPEFAEALREQLEDDEDRWGNTWLHRPRKGQEHRVMDPRDGSSSFRRYWDQWYFGDAPIPWLKVAGEALICWIRDQHPELFPQKEEGGSQE